MKSLIASTWLIATITLGGCASTTPEWESKFGGAFLQGKEEQTLDRPAVQEESATTSREMEARTQSYIKDVAPSAGAR